MNNHLKIYKQFFDIGEQEISLCEVCGRPACEIHHICFKSHGGDNSIMNLIGVCRQCHSDLHSYTLSKDVAHQKHDEFVISKLRVAKNKIELLDEKSLDHYLKLL